MLKFRDRVRIAKGFYATYVGVVTHTKWFGLRYKVEYNEHCYFEEWFWKWELERYAPSLFNTLNGGVEGRQPDTVAASPAYTSSRVLPLP